MNLRALVLMFTALAWAPAGLALPHLARAAPAYTGTVAVPYHVAFRNLRAAIAKCSEYERLFTGSAIAEDRSADLTIYQLSADVVPLAHYALNGTDDGGTRILLWLNKPTFGAPIYDQLRKATPALALAGAATDCTAAGF